MLKNLLKYIKTSGIWTGFVLNPYHWQFVIKSEGVGELAPSLFGKFISIGPVWIRVIVDDGSVR
jgi:hypothetical protein